MSVLLLLTTVLATSPGGLETAAATQVVREYERIGLRAPVSDPVLVEAARGLAARALDNGAQEATDVLGISNLVSDAGGTDPTPRALVIRSTPPEFALETFLKRQDLNEAPATAFGVGVVIREDRAALAVLLAERKATIKPFPRAMTHPGSRQLCGELVEPLAHAEIYITRPSGEVDKVGLTRDHGTGFCAMPSFGVEGRHQLEVVGHGPRGPEVAALFSVDVGASRSAATRVRELEPTQAESARAILLARINALRGAQGLSALSLDPQLTQVAQAYSEQMQRGNYFAHVDPEGKDLRARLRRAGYAYDRAGENLGLAEGPLAAHFALEHSPGHRKNLLEPDFTHVGFGLAFSTKNERPQVLLTEIFARPSVASTETVKDAYRTLAAKRATLGLPPLERSETLEQIAISHARRALELDTPKERLAGSNLHDRVFRALPDAKSTSVDLVIAEGLAHLPDSKALADARNDTFAIGSVKGDSARYGKEKFWLVIIYADVH